MYICQNCRELYKPPHRKDGICKTCNDIAITNIDTRKEKHKIETEELKQLHASEMQVLKQQMEMLRYKQAAELETLKARHELQLQHARTIALLKRYQPPSINEYLKI